MKDIITKLFEGIDASLISEDVRANVGKMIDELVENRVQAKTVDLVSQLKELNSKIEVANLKEQELKQEIEEVENIVKEEAKNYAEMVNKSLAEKETIMYETLNEYKESVEKVLKNVALEYRKHLEQVVAEECENYRKHIEEIAIQEVAEYKQLHESTVAEEMQSFKDDLLEKMSSYMEAELVKSIPKEIMESTIQVAAYKPLVENILNVLQTNHIKLDTTGYETLKKAKEENQKLSESYNVKLKELVKSESRVKELEKEVKLGRLTEGMTLVQKKKAYTLLEGCSLEDIDNKFTQIKDIIIEESVKTPERVRTNQVLSESARKQIYKMTENVSKTSDKNDEMSNWAKTLNDLRNL